MNGSSFSSEAYTNAFIQDRPKAAAASVQARSKRAELICVSLAGHLSERALIEETYAKSLAKLSRKSIIPESYGLDEGGHASAWRTVLARLETELQETMSLHENFSNKLEEQVVGSLRDKAKAGDSGLRQHDNTIGHAVKSYDEAESRMSKAQSKSSRKDNSKIQSSQYELTEAHSLWTSSAPAFLSAHQNAEHTRLEAIKENLAKYETMCNDLGREKMEIAERGLVSVLSWEIDDDVNAFLAAEGNRRATGSNGSALSAATSRASEMEMGEVDRSYNSPSTPQQQHQVVPERQVAPAIAPSAFLASPQRESAPSIHSVQSRNENSGKSSGGLFSSFTKKLKPGLGRSRSSSHGNSSYGNIDQSRASPARQNSSNNYDAPSEPYRNASTREDEAESLSSTRDSNDYPASTTSSKRSSFLPGMMRRKNSVSNKPPTPVRAGSSSARVGGLLAPPSEENPPQSRENFTPTPTRESTNPFDRPTSMFVNGTQQQEQQQINQRQTAAVDAEGFSVPPANYDRTPWEGNVGGASLMDDDIPESSSSPKINMDIAQTSPPVDNERPEDRQAALLSVQSALLSKAPASNLNRRATRGRRDVVRASTLNLNNGSNDDVPLAQVVEMQQANGTTPSSPDSFASPASHLSTASIPYPGSSLSGLHPQRSASVMSASSSQVSPSTMAGGLLSNPSGSGLRALITESVNVLVKAGTAPRVMITGEVSLLLKGSSNEPLRIRINQHSALAKSAPNTQFLQPDQYAPDEFTINASSLASVSQGGSATVVLRYQVAVPEERAEDYIPVQVNPQWRTEATQTFLLINYSANPACRFINASASPFESDATVLQDLAFVIPVTSDGVENVQSKPLALYSSEKKRLLWKLDDLDMESAAPQKALARFAVTSQSSPQPVAVKWKVTGKLISGISLEVIGSDMRVEETACVVQAAKYLVSS